MKYEKAYLESLLEFSKKDPVLMAELAGGVCADGDIIEISYLGQICYVTHPGGKIRLPAWPELHHEEQILILQYLAKASGLPCRSSWLSFLDLPGGPHHFVPFQRAAINPLAKAFANQPDLFLPAAKTLGGVQIDLGHVGVVLPVFPRLPLAMLLWIGDDEFPTAADILFDAVAQTYLSTASLYVLGIEAAKRLIDAGAMGGRS